MICAVCSALPSPALNATSARIGRLATAISRARVSKSLRSFATAGVLDFRICPACGSVCEGEYGRLRCLSAAAAEAKAGLLRRTLALEQRGAARRAS